MRIAFLALLLISVSFSLTNVSSCGTLSTANEIYVLNQSISNSAVTCITFGANNITLDCQGYTIDGTDAAATYGIYLNGKANSTIKNCVITDFYYGIYLYSSSNNNLITNNSASSNSIGIRLYSSNSSTITNNSASSNTYGIQLNSYSNSNTLSNNNASSNSIGIRVDSSSNNTLANNTANSNTNYGIYLYSSSNSNTLANNTATSNEYGIHLSSSSNNNLTNNNASSNVYGIFLQSSSNSNILANNTANSNLYGIYLYSSSNSNILANNTASSNSRDGINLKLSNNSILTNNNASSNSWDGIVVDSSSNNTLTNITANSNPYGIYLQVSSNKNTLTNITATGNSQYGFYLTASSSNNISNSTSCSNGAGGYYFTLNSNSNVGSGNKGNITDLDSNTGFSSSNCTEAQQSYYIVLNSPPNSALLGSSSVTLNWAPYNFASNPTCNVSRNGTLIFSAACTNNQSCTTANATADGSYYWNATCSDGTSANASATWQFAVDTLPPALQMQSPQNTTYNASSVNLNYTVFDPNIDECWYALDGTNHSLPGCGNASVAAGEGPHNITVYANDTTGSSNFSGVSFTLDTTPPAVSIQNPANSTYNATSVSLNFTASDSGAGIDRCWYSLDGGNSTALPGCANATVTPSADGPHTLIVYANDSAGNRGSAGISLTFNSLKTNIKLALRNRDLRPSTLVAISLDGDYVAFSPELHFPSGSRQIISFGLTKPLCNSTGQLIYFNRVTLYYRQSSSISGLAQTGSIPLVAKCG